MAGRMGILARGALAGLLSLGALAGCGPIKFALESRRPLSFEQSTVAVVAEGRRLRVGEFEVTWQDWKRCYEAGGCSYLPRPARIDGGKTFPVVGVNRLDVDEFIAWANKRGTRQYRLPTAEEWNAFAAALPKPKTEKLFTDPRLAWAADYLQMPALPARVQPSGDFGVLPNGLKDLGGNVWEWTATCAAGDAADDRCPAYVAQGLHEAAISVFIRDPATGGCAAGVPPPHVGFRLVSDIEELHA